MAGKCHRSHTDPLFSALKILKFEDLFKWNCSIFMHKYLQNSVPDSFENFFVPLSEPNRTNGFIIDKIKNNFLSQFPTYFLPKIWNSNSLAAKSLQSHNTFKHWIYSSYISEYPPMVKCADRKCPDCC